MPPTTVAPPIDTAALEAAAKRFCDLSTAYVAQVRDIEMSLTDPTRLRELLSSAVPASAESVPIASKDIKTDVSRVSDSLVELRDALEAASYDIAKLAPEMVSKLQSPAVQGALRNVENFAREGC